MRRYGLHDDEWDRIKDLPVMKVASLNDLANTPVSAATLGAGNVVVPGLLSNVATIKRGSVPTNSNQTNIQPVYDVYASTQGRDLGSTRQISTRSWRICRRASSPAIRSRSSARSRA
jgi:hypothetical protein